MLIKEIKNLDRDLKQMSSLAQQMKGTVKWPRTKKSSSLDEHYCDSLVGEQVPHKKMATDRMKSLN